MINDFTFDEYELLYVGASLSFVTPYISLRFDIILDHFFEPFSVSQPVGESIPDNRVYHYCTISINHKDTMDDLVALDMVHFDVILGMYWIHVCYASVDCITRVVKF